MTEPTSELYTPKLTRRKLLKQIAQVAASAVVVALPHHPVTAQSFDNSPHADNTPLATLEREKIITEQVLIKDYFLNIADAPPSHVTLDMHKLAREHPSLISNLQNEEFDGWVFNNPNASPAVLDFSGCEDKTIILVGTSVKNAAISNVDPNLYNPDFQPESGTHDVGYGETQAGLVLLGNFIVEAPSEQNALLSCIRNNSYQSYIGIYARSRNPQKQLDTIVVNNIDMVGIPISKHDSKGSWWTPPPAGIYADDCNIEVTGRTINGAVTNDPLFVDKLQLESYRDWCNRILQQVQINPIANDTIKRFFDSISEQTDPALSTKIFENVSPHVIKHQVAGGIRVQNTGFSKNTPHLSVKNCTIISPWDAIAASNITNVTVKDTQLIQDPLVQASNMTTGSGIALIHSPLGDLNIENALIIFHKGVWRSQSSNGYGIKLNNCQFGPTQWAFVGNGPTAIDSVVIQPTSTTTKRISEFSQDSGLFENTGLVDLVSPEITTNDLLFVIPEQPDNEVILLFTTIIYPEFGNTPLEVANHMKKTLENLSFQVKTQKNDGSFTKKYNYGFASDIYPILQNLQQPYGYVGIVYDAHNHRVGLVTQSIPHVQGETKDTIHWIGK